MKHSKSNDVVITAMGCVSPIGNSVEEFRRALFRGESGVRAIRGSRVAQNFPVPYAAFIAPESLIIPDYFAERNAHGKTASFVELVAASATDQAVRPMGLDESKSDLHIDAIVYGTADGIGYEAIRENFQNFPDIDVRDVRGERPLQAIARVLNHYGITFDERQLISINGACSSGNQALGMAMQRIRRGEWKRALVGGVDARCSPQNLMNFHMLGALCDDDIAPEKASRPFAGDRSGFIRGEGAATLILETRAAAEKRGAKILAVLSGYANTTDANRLTDGRDDVLCVKRAIEWSISDAGLKLEDIDAVSAHGTSTPLNDKLETKAIKEVFGARAYHIPVTSLKSQIGHSTVAAGALEAVSCVLMLQEQKLAPTINHHVPDPECDLDYVPNVARPAKLNYMLSNNFAFGGQNACLVFAKEEWA